MELIAADHELSKTHARKVFGAVLGTIIEAAAKGDEVALGGFGGFKAANRAARQGRNPATGETIAILALGPDAGLLEPERACTCVGRRAVASGFYV